MENNYLSFKLIGFYRIIMEEEISINLIPSDSPKINGSRVDSLPYYNEPTFTLHWIDFEK